MGTDVNQVAWKNAELMAYALLESDKAQVLSDYLLLFGSFLDIDRHGKHSVSSSIDGDITFSVDGDEFVFSGEQLPLINSLTKILYESFYKHQF